MKVVLDTDVMVAAVESAAGASRQLLVRALRCEFATACSPSLFVEYEAVLTRLAAAGTTESAVRALLDALAEVVEPVSLDFRWRPTGADPDDELVLETAINGEASMIVTFNIRHMTSAADFGIAVMRPGDALRRLTT
ncbi:MAG: putative toxin-antitoxin system toxin component, PIN family [Sphingomonadales bacterium]|nr:putative toxin-antitoxin system toxin component, PIN family [Sphingomonadales bacterium]